MWHYENVKVWCSATEPQRSGQGQGGQTITIIIIHSALHSVFHHCPVDSSSLLELPECNGKILLEIYLLKMINEFIFNQHLKYL